MTYKGLKASLSVFAGASVKLARIRKCSVFFLGPSGKRGNWGRELNRVLVLREQQLQNAVFCE